MCLCGLPSVRNHAPENPGLKHEVWMVVSVWKITTKEKEPFFFEITVLFELSVA